MTRTRFSFVSLLLVVLVTVSVLAPALAHAAPSIQGEDRKARADALYNEGMALYNAGKYQVALEKWQAALEIYKEIGDQAREGRTLYNIGNVYWTLEQYQEALKYCEETLAIFHGLGDRADEGVILNNIGLLYQNLGQYELALDYLQQSLTIAKDVGDWEGEGRTLTNIGLVYDGLGQYERALEYYQQALAIAETTSDRSGEGAALANIGGDYEAMGQYGQALDYYQQALVILKEVGDWPEEGTILANIGGIYNYLGRYEQALDYFHQALTIFKEVGSHKGEEVTLNHIADTYYSLGQYEAALYYLQQALVISRDIGYRVGEGATLTNIGMVYRALGQYEQALSYHQQALAIIQEMGNREGEGATLTNIGDVYHSLEQYEMALDYYQQALTIAEDIGDRAGEGVKLNSIGAIYDELGQYEQALDYYQQALVILREIGYRAGEGAALANIGFVYEYQGDISQAITFYQQAIDVTEAIQGDISTSELKAAFVSTEVGTYERLIGLLWEEARFEEVFNYVERARARAFLDQLASGAVDFRAGAASGLLEREQALRAEIAALRAQLVTLRNRPRDEWDTKAIAAAQAKLTTREADYSALVIELKVQSPDVASLVSVDVASLADIQMLLDPDTTLVEYFVTEERTLVFIITDNTFETLALDVSREDLTETITTFRDFASLENPHPTSLKQLYAWLIAPLEPHLTTPALGIVPHGILHYLPFAALTDGERYLNDDYVLFNLPSASALRFIQEKRKPKADTVLALGNPTTAEPLPDLRFAEQEVERIADLYGTQALVGADAAESVVWSQAGKASILHLAAHGEYNPFNPLFSVIHLAGDAQHDGRLEVHEIYGLDLTTATNLVVLSACQTQIGALSAGDEVIGLNRAFLYAGTPSVMASLWHVDDEATALLMERFYTHLRDGLGKAEALRQAQIELRAKYPHPYYWAAFVLTGDGGETTSEIIVSTATSVVVPTPINTPTLTPTKDSKVGVSYATPVTAATEGGASEPTPGDTGGRLCGSVALSLGLVMLTVVFVGGHARFGRRYYKDGNRSA